MSGSSLTEGGGGWKTPPQCCTGRKKPSAFRVNIQAMYFKVTAVNIILNYKYVDLEIFTVKLRYQLSSKLYMEIITLNLIQKTTR